MGDRISYDLDDIKSVGGVRSSAIPFTTILRYEFIVYLKTDAAYTIHYDTKFEAYAVREALMGALLEKANGK